MGSSFHLGIRMGPSGAQTLDDLLTQDFSISGPFVVKRDDEKIVEVYRRIGEEDSKYYRLSNLNEYDLYMNNLAHRLKVQLLESSGKSETSA